MSLNQSSLIYPDQAVDVLRKFLDAYISTYMNTQTHPTPVQESDVMNLATEARKLWRPLDGSDVVK